MALARAPITLDQFLALSEAEPALEYADGEVTQKVSPKGQHSGLQYFLSEWINQAGRSQRTVRAFPELRVTFSGRSYVPDVAAYRWHRVPTNADGNVADDFLEPPGLVIEIVSPGQRVTSLTRKCIWYMSNGVRVALLVDPTDRSVVAFRPGELPLALQKDDAVELPELLPELRLTVNELFQSLSMR
jgi:Uma2 family endonuclease